MKSFVLRLFHSNGELSDFARKSVRLVDERTRRKAVKIAAIDDNPFQPQTNLQNYGYDVTAIGDIKSVSEVEGYNIVLCDLMGVGKHFDEKNQGVSVIAEIKKTYPSKIVVAYTGAAMTNALARSAGQRADLIIRKDVDNDEWVANLDQLTKEAVDPFIIWNKTRGRLIELGADTKVILELEDAYVASVLARDSTFSQVRGVLRSTKLGGDVRAIVQGVISSIIFKMIFGS